MANKFLIENELFKIYGPDELMPYVEQLLSSISLEAKNILTFFDVSIIKKVTVNLFNNQGDYLSYTRQFYEPQTYSRGNFIGNTINHTYDSSDLNGKLYFIRNSIIHEFVHMVYKIIYEDLFNRVVWLDEGLAQYLSKQKNMLQDDDIRFRNWFLDSILRRDKEIPKIEYLSNHGSKYGEFVDKETNKYDGYAISYLLVKYLFDTKQNVLSILKNINLIEEMEENIINDAIDYYINKYEISDYLDDVNKIRTLQELMDYMNRNILYGWLDKSGNQHLNTLEDIRTLYRTSSINEILKYKIGNCIEQTLFEKYIFDKLGLENRMFCYRAYEDELNLEAKISMHCFCLVEIEGYWYHFEHSNSLKRGITQYDSVDSAINSIIESYPEDIKKVRVLTEIPDVPSGLSFRDFNLYVNSFDDLIKKL